MLIKKNKAIKKNTIFKPFILAPAGNYVSFLAALASGSDGIYCGLKNFSARMGAKNFSIDELSSLSILAKKKGVKVYIAMNTILKPDEIQTAGKTVDLINKYIKPYAIIIQDFGLISLIRKAGFKGKIHLSTLTNVSFPSALEFIYKKLNINSVVLPRELNVDEIKLMSKACPKNLTLEVFVHGALCYAISGRCYWSSYMGGKSSLRGRCVQPCRRKYLQGKNKQKFFSCRDFSLGVLTKILYNIPKVGTWKIEGRKKGAHYVFYTVSAYKMLRDYIGNADMKKKATYFLDNCLGRHSTNYNFLSHRPKNPVKVEIQTNSGLMIGKIKGDNKLFFISNQELIPGDVIRIGYEDNIHHSVIRINCHIPKKGKFYINISNHGFIKKGSPVFLKDRMEKNIKEKINIIEQNYNFNKITKSFSSNFTYSPIRTNKIKRKIINMQVNRTLNKIDKEYVKGVWINDSFLSNIKKLLNNNKTWIWLPPTLWHKDELNIIEIINKIVDKGIHNFVLNMPWQMVFFKKYKFLNIWAGPFCNISNALSLQVFKDMGFKGAIVSPELSLTDYIKLAYERPIPLGIVIQGNWPLCISRFISKELETEYFFKSPKKEGGWITKYQQNYWLFPDWKIDITNKRDILIKAGYNMFVDLVEIVPHEIKLKKRPGLWNLKIGLK